MRFALDPVDRQLLLGAGAVLVVVVVATLILAPQANRVEEPTTYSAGSTGAKAAWLLLKESGYRVERWEQPLRHLPRSKATIVIAEPAAAPPAADVERLRSFILDGGRVLISGPFAEAFVPDAATVPRPWATGWQRVAALSPAAITRDAPEITLVPQAYWKPGSSAQALYADGERAVVVRYGYGQGEVIWWASATPLTNAGLKEPGNLEFFLACLGPARDGPIVFDEFEHGHWGGRAETRVGWPFGWLAVQVALIALAVVLTFSRRSGPVLAPAADTRLSPLEFVQTLGGLYQRAGAASVAVDICHQRFRYWLARRLGTSANTGIHELESLLRERWRFDDPDFADTLRACETSRENPRLRPRDALRLVQALFRYAAALRLFERPGADAAASLPVRRPAAPGAGRRDRPPA